METIHACLAHAEAVSTSVSCVADSLKNLVPRLGKRGPHRVLTGDLNFAGIPGRVYTPAEGKGIPGIAFGHDWRVGAKAYHATLRHLASWGFAVAAPDTERGVLPNHRGFASDLETSLQILAGVKLGQGNVTVHPSKLYLAGHGMGAAAAVLAATAREYVKGSFDSYGDKPTLAGVMAVYPADANPSPYDAAQHVDAPGLVLSPGGVHAAPSGNPERLAANWQGEVVYRRMDKASQAGFHENYGRRLVMGSGLPEFSAQETVRGLMTGFVLADESRKYKAFRDPRAELKDTSVKDQLELYRELPENIDVEEALSNIRLG